MALDISQGGILIETAVGVFSKYIKLISVDHNKNIIEIKGKVAYCKMEKSKKYLSSISFAENLEKTSTLQAANQSLLLKIKMNIVKAQLQSAKPLFCNLNL